MRILYIAFDNPAVDTILGGMHDDKLTGLPALYYPFKLLLKRGHTVDLLLFSPDKNKPFVESEHFKKENFIHAILPKNSGIRGKFAFIKKVRSTTRKQLKSRKYDFVYGLAEGAILGVSEAQKMGIPCAYRQFGIYNDFEKRVRKRKTLLGKRITAFLHHTYVYLAMRAKMDFLLMTNDGSHPEVIYDMLKQRKRYRYYFWRSGINMPDERPMPTLNVSGQYPEGFDKNAIVQISRFSPEKCQSRTATILGILRKRGHDIQLYYVGDDSSAEVKNAITLEGEKWGVNDYIHFEGKRPQAMAWKYSRNSLACIISNESGLGNVFYENMAQGSAIVAAKASTLDSYIKSGVNGFQFSSEEEAADQIEKMLSDEQFYWKLRENAFDTAKKRFLSIEERFGMEADLIEDTAKGLNTDKYPANL